MSEINMKPELPSEDDFSPSAARLVDSLRDTGYSREAAFADIIDNSIAANATKIRLELQYHLGDLRVTFTDNGDGMSESDLVKGMRYGAPKRENPKSLGKFGMGLKTASTAFCERLVVLTLKDGIKSSRAWDLDVIRDTDSWKLEAPDQEDYEEDFEELEENVGNIHGTRIIWEKIDRLISLSSDAKINEELIRLGAELNEELSAVFARFLDKENNEHDDISITLVINGVEEELKPWCPMCKKLTFVNEDAKVQKLPVRTVKVDGTDESFTLTGSIIPVDRELTTEEKKLTRYNLDNQGLYIYREGRLIWHDGWPQRIYKKESKVTRLRVVLDFTHGLDDLFEIDFRKSRIVIPKAIRDILKKQISPWRTHAINKPTGQVESSTPQTSRNHNRSNIAIDKHKEQTKVAEVMVEDEQAYIKNRYNKINPVLVEGVHIYPDGSIRVREEDSLVGNILWCPALDHEGEACVQLGKSHPYFERAYDICKDNPDAMVAIDMLLWALSNAEIGTYSDANKRVLRAFRQDVSNNLTHLCEELPDPQED
jgi:hypothetical protein